MALKSEMFSVYYVYCSHDSNIKKNYWRGSRAENVKEHFVHFLYVKQFVHSGWYCIPLKNSTNLYKGFEGIRYVNDTSNH
jgi:hypothetical protein